MCLDHHQLASRFTLALLLCGLSAILASPANAFCPPGYYPTIGGGCAPYGGNHIPGSSWMWAGTGLGLGVTDNGVTTVQQRTFNVIDALSGDTFAGLHSTNFRGDIEFGWDTVLGGWPNWPNLGNRPNWGAPFTFGIQGTFGYADSDSRVNRIPGSGLFTPGGSGTDYVRLRGGWNASIGPRLGVFITPPNSPNLGADIFFYLTGGAAFEEFESTVNCGTGLCGQNAIPQATLTNSEWRTGYFYGGGFTVPLAGVGDGNWRAGVELRENDFGHWKVTTGNPATYQGSFDYHLTEFSAMFSVRHNWATAMSDARMKRDIVLLSRLDSGLGLYRYRYLWSDQRYVGVMAQEVALMYPDSVVHGDDGYLRVNYARLGLRLQTWEEWTATH